MSDVTRGRKKLVAKSFCRYGSGVISYLEPLVMKCDRYHFPKIDKDCPLRKCGAVFFCPCDNPFDIRDYYLSVADTHEWEDYGLAHMWSIYTDRWFAFLQRLRPEYLLMLTDTISTDFWMHKLAKMDLNDMAYTRTNKPFASIPAYQSDAIFLEPTMHAPHQVLIVAKRLHSREERLELEKSWPQDRKMVRAIEQYEWLKGASVETCLRWICNDVMPWTPVGDLCLTRSPLAKIATECGRKFVGIDQNIRTLCEMLAEQERQESECKSA